MARHTLKLKAVFLNSLIYIMFLEGLPIFERAELSRKLINITHTNFLAEQWMIGVNSKLN